MSKIVGSNLVTPPEDKIIISINNLTGQANMALSRDLPAPYVASVLARLVAQTMDDVMRRMTAEQAAATGVKAPGPRPV